MYMLNAACQHAQLGRERILLTSSKAAAVSEIAPFGSAMVFSGLCLGSWAAARTERKGCAERHVVKSTVWDTRATILKLISSPSQQNFSSTDAEVLV